MATLNFIIAKDCINRLIIKRRGLCITVNKNNEGLPLNLGQYWSRQRGPLYSDDIISQYTSVSFDLSIFDIFSCLKVGSKLLPIPEFFFSDMKKICRFIQRESVTVWYSVPSVFLRNCDYDAWKFLKNSSLRHVIFAGEVIPVDNCCEFIKYLPENCRIHNWYGPTETNVCTYYEIPKNTPNKCQSIPIGTPCPYAKIDYLGKNNTSGIRELLVSGKTLMLQYWRNPKKTFDATLKIGNEVFYKTGDFVSLNRERKLVLKGRNDRQIKINGHRIQLEEIEGKLIKHLTVNEAAVIYIKKNLIAFIAANFNRGFN